ncbi:MAG: transposase [Notoacmeibacter sp.]|nr:transposase [Notoacmeibacter sp.]
MRLALTSGRTRKEGAEDLGIGLSLLTRWIGQYRGEEVPPDVDEDLQGELRRLRKGNALLKQGREMICSDPRKTA